MDRGSVHLLLRAILAGPAGLRQWRALHTRQGCSRPAMIDAFQSEQVREIGREVVAHCQTRTIESEFPIELGDDLYSLYGFTIGDIADTVSSICDKCGVTRPSGAQLSDACVRTVNDLIQFIAAGCPSPGDTAAM